MRKQGDRCKRERESLDRYLRETGKLRGYTAFLQLNAAFKAGADQTGIKPPPWWRAALFFGTQQHPAKLHIDVT